MVLIPRHALFDILHSRYRHKALTDECIGRYIVDLEDRLGFSFDASESDRRQLKAELFRLRTKGLRCKRKGGRQFNHLQHQLKSSRYLWSASVNRHTSEQKAIDLKIKYQNEIRSLNEKKKLIEENFVSVLNEQKKKDELAKIQRAQTSSDCVTCQPLPFRDYTNCQSQIGKTERYVSSGVSVTRKSNVYSLIVERNGEKEKIKLNEQSQEIDLYRLLFILDNYNISSETYHELSMNFRCLPRSHTVKQLQSRLNSEFNIKPTPDGLGVEQSLRQRLTAVVSQSLSDGVDFSDDLKIKISADGTNIGKRHHIVNVTFTILNESQCGSAHGNYPLCIVSTKERYHELCLGLSNLRHEVDDLQGSTVLISNREFTLTVLLGGDYKFLLIAVGISSISANYTCVYCKCSRSERGNLKKEWSISDPDKGARLAYTNKIQSSGSSGKKRKQDIYSDVNPPLFASIPPSKVVIDHLHLFLRVTDKLFNLLVAELRCLDNIKTNATFSEVNKDKMKHVTKLERQLQLAGIRFELTINKDTRKLEYRELQGPEKLRLLNILNVFQLFDDADRAALVQEIWNGFGQINELLKSSAPNVDEVRKKIGTWFSLYLTAYQVRDVTPYLHILRHHVVELIQLHGNLIQFTQQGLEKLNDNVTKQYYRATNHGGNAMRQILEKQNRLIHLAKFKRQKEFKMACSSCRGTGHRRNKCPRTHTE